MRCILRDRERLWYLSSVDAAGSARGALAAPSAIAILSDLLRDEANLQAIRGLLRSEYPYGQRAIPRRERALLPDLEARFARREWALIPGPEIDLKAALTRATRKGAGRTRTLRVFDFNTGDFARTSEFAIPKAAQAPQDAIPPIRFSGGHERPDWLVFGHGSGREPALALEHGIGDAAVPEFAPAAESGPEPSFAHAAEAPRGFGLSAAVETPA